MVEEIPNIKNKKSIVKRLFIGFKKGYDTPTLPENILKIEIFLNLIIK